jgi:hypothetical protein
MVFEAALMSYPFMMGVSLGSCTNRAYEQGGCIGHVNTSMGASAVSVPTLKYKEMLDGSDADSSGREPAASVSLNKLAPRLSDFTKAARDECHVLLTNAYHSVLLTCKALS